MRLTISGVKVKNRNPGVMFSFLVLLSLTMLLSARSQTRNNGRDSAILHLQKQGTATQLIVDGKPLLMLAGETGNSSASNLEYMNAIWPKVEKMHLNALVVPVYWELLEPKEGVFDFTLVDSIIISARLHNMKLVFLWFGTWKNSMSCYVPMWVKADQERFPRARQKDGRAEEILTAFNNTNRTTDAHAFAALMKHLRSIDEKEQTVVLVQVENEIGMIPDARDHSKGANESFRASVPAKLVSYLQEHKEKLNSGFR